jgi:hypothetical protein
MFGFFLPFILKIHILKNPYIAGMETMKFIPISCEPQGRVITNPFPFPVSVYYGFKTGRLYFSFDNIGAN